MKAQVREEPTQVVGTRLPLGVISEKHVVNTITMGARAWEVSRWWISRKRRLPMGLKPKGSPPAALFLTFWMRTGDLPRLAEQNGSRQEATNCIPRRRDGMTRSCRH